MDILTSHTHETARLQALAAQQPAEDISVKDEPSEAKPQARPAAFHLLSDAAVLHGCDQLTTLAGAYAEANWRQTQVLCCLSTHYHVYL